MWFTSTSALHPSESQGREREHKSLKKLHPALLLMSPWPEVSHVFDQKLVMLPHPAARHVGKCSLSFGQLCSQILKLRVLLLLIVNWPLGENAVSQVPSRQGVWMWFYVEAVLLGVCYVMEWYILIYMQKTSLLLCGRNIGGKNGAGDSGSYFKSRRDMLMAYTRVGAAGQWEGGRYRLHVFWVSAFLVGPHLRSYVRLLILLVGWSFYYYVMSSLPLVLCLLLSVLYWILT